MKTVHSDPQVVSLSTLIYRLLLVAYPKNFQREYASSMAQVFRDCCLRAFHTGGLPGILVLWSLALVDYIKSVFTEYTSQELHINTSRFIRLSGWTMMVGAIAFLTRMLIEVLFKAQVWVYFPNKPPDLQNRIRYVIDVLPFVLMPSAMLLLVIGVIGLLLRYGSRASSIGKVGLVVSIVGGSLALVMCIAEYPFLSAIFLVDNLNWVWWPAVLGMVALFFLFGGIYTFGINAVKCQLLPRWNILPILAATLFPVRIILGCLQSATTGYYGRWRWVDITLLDPPIFIITSFGLITLGYMLMSGSQRKEQLLMAKPGKT